MKVYAQSDEFEIKPLGSTYPATTSSIAAASSTSGGASPTQTTGSNGAVGYLSSSAQYPAIFVGAVGALIGATVM